MSESDGDDSQVALKELSAEEIAELQEIFNLVDEDRGGSISPQELQSLMATMGIHTTQEEIDKIMAEIDENNDGEIQFEEFVAVMSRKVSASYSSDDVIEAFQLFTLNSPPGNITLEQLELSLTQYGPKLNKEKATKLIEDLEVDDNGYFDYESYVSLIMND
eukprot:354308_1